MADCVVPGRGEIAIGRLRKKVAKLTAQRDHWKAQHEVLRSFVARLGLREVSMKRLSQAASAELENIELKQRIREQSALIRKLSKDDAAFPSHSQGGEP